MANNDGNNALKTEYYKENGEWIFWKEGRVAIDTYANLKKRVGNKNYPHFQTTFKAKQNIEIRKHDGEVFKTIIKWD